MDHLNRYHPKQYKVATDQRSNVEQENKRQELKEENKGDIYVNGTPKMADFLQRKTKYSPDNTYKRELVKLLVQRIADGILPYEHIDNNR